MMREITCERCGGIAIRSPLCGSCAYALGEVAWQRIKARIAPTVSDEVLDHWMDTHKDNPANLETDPANTEQQRHEDMFSFEQFRDAQGRLT